MKKFLFAIIILTSSTFELSYSQKALIYDEPQSEYHKGMELFNKEKFNSAKECFNKTIEGISDIQSEMRINSEYYAAICAIELFYNDAEYLLNQFIINHPENSKVKLANFQLAKLYYRQKKYTKAVKTFEIVDVYDLNSEDLPEYYFKLGYSYFMDNSFDKAKNQFFEIIEIDTKYFAAANYYYATYFRRIIF